MYEPTYRVQATILYPADAAGYRRTLQVPTFELSAHVHGLTSIASAQQFACTMLGAIAGPDTLVHAIVSPPYCQNELGGYWGVLYHRLRLAYPE
jgi:hypothetical protein